MENLWLVLFWTGPIGVGISLVCLGGMIYLIAKADAMKNVCAGRKKRRNNHVRQTHIVRFTVKRLPAAFRDKLKRGAGQLRLEDTNGLWASLS